MSLSYKIVETGSEFAGMEGDWNRLLRESRSDTIFLRWEWQFSWWETFGGELFIVTVRERDDLIAILPLIRARKFGFDRLRLIGAPDSDYLDFIIKTGHEKQVLEFFFSDFPHQHRAVGIVELEAINERSPNISWLLDHLPAAGFGLELSDKLCPYISLPGSWEEYLAKLSKSTRYFIGRKERKMLREHQARIGVVADPTELERRMTQFMRQHQHRWERRDKPGAFSRSVMQRFHQTVAKRLFAAGWLRLYYLDIGDQPIASYYVFQYNQCMLYYLSGFDMRYANRSPGVVLLAGAVRDAIAAGMKEFDLMRGAGDYKFKWTEETRLNRSFVMYRKSAPVLLYRGAIQSWTRTRLGLKERFPRGIRRYVRRRLPSWLRSRIDVLFRPS